VMQTSEDGLSPVQSTGSAEKPTGSGTAALRQPRGFHVRAEPTISRSVSHL